jgi:hypothetical protein
VSSDTTGQRAVTGATTHVDPARHEAGVALVQVLVDEAIVGA